MSPWLSDLFLRSQSDERLVALAQEGHERAFAAIVDRYLRPLLAFARRTDPGRAEDLVQQTFVSALTALRTGAEVRHLRGWLYEILRNLSARRPTVVSAELADAESLTDSAEQVAERRMLAHDALDALAQLPPRQYHALLQVAIHGRSGSEVAEAMEMTEGAVRQLVHRARARVRAAVTAIMPFPLLRWVSSPRSADAVRLTDATVASGAASTAGMAVKLGVGALMATGIVAGGVISAGVLHQGHRRSLHPLPARVTRGGTPGSGAAQPAGALSLAASVGVPAHGPAHPPRIIDHSASRHSAGTLTGSPGTQREPPGDGSRGSNGTGSSEGGSGPGADDHPGGDSDPNDAGHSSHRDEGATSAGTDGSDDGASGSGGPGPNGGSDDGGSEPSGAGGGPSPFAQTDGSGSSGDSGSSGSGSGPSGGSTDGGPRTPSEDSGGRGRG
jgi:RNA polymerase sigma factor (sigma-70 family)